MSVALFLSSGGGGGGDPDAPTISNVTGTVGTGNALTITGTQLYHQDRTGLDVTAAIANMEGASAAADGYGTGGSSSYHGSLKIWKDGSVIGKRHSGAGQFTNGIWNDDWSASLQHRYVRFMVYFDTSVGDGSWPSNYWKIWYNAPGPARQYPLDFVGNSGNAPTAVVWIDQNVTGNNIVTANLPEAVQNGKFNSVVLGIPQGSPHLFECWWNSVKIIEENWTNSPQSDSNYYDTQLDTNGDGDLGSGFAADCYWGMVEHSSSRLYDPTIVYIGDTDNFDTASPKYQYLTQISDTENKIACDLDGLTGPNYWMWVVNARNLRSAAYAL